MGFNRYSYAVNNPFKYIDPTGEKVDAVFNKATGRLTVTDRDNGNSVTASAFSGSDGMASAPNGSYTITDFPWGRSLKDTYFAIVRHDERLNDIAEGFESNYEYNERSKGKMENLRLHLGETSHGCVSVPKPDEWSPVQNMLDNTSTGEVEIEGEKFPDFGQLTIIDGPALEPD